MKSINFEYLRTLYPDLADLGAAAEGYAHGDPASALVKLRLFAECIVNVVYERHGIAAPYQDDLCNRINAPRCVGVLGRAATDALHRLRLASKQGAHFGHSPQSDLALDRIRLAFDLGYAFLERLHGTGVKRQEFVPPPPGGSSGASKEELKRQKRDALRQVEALTVQLDEGRRELAELRQQVAADVLGVLAGEPLSVDPAEASALLNSYRAELSRWAERTILHSAVAVPIPGPSLAKRVRAGRSVQILGPSGIGKSQALIGLAVELCVEHVLPIFARAALFDGDVDDWLDRAVAVYSRGSAATLLRMARATDTQIVVVVDAANECAPQHTAKLKEFILSLHLGCKVATALSSRSPFIGEEASFDDLCVGDYDAAARSEIFRLYAPPGVREVPSFVHCLRTPLEVRLAAECLKDVGSEPTRQELLRAYARKQLERLPSPLASDRTLRAVALEMSKKLQQSLSIEQFRRVAEAQFVSEGLAVESVMAVERCGLVDVIEGRVMFQHELFRRSFRAEAMVRGARGDDLAGLVNHAASDEVRELVVQSIDDGDALRDLVSSSPTLWPLLRNAAVGHLGPVAREVVVDEVRRLVDDAMRALPASQVLVAVIDERHGQTEEAGAARSKRFRVEIRQSVTWTAYERAVFSTLGHLADEPLFLPEARRLLRETDERLAGEAQRLQIRESVVFTQAYSPMSARLPACEVASARTFTLGFGFGVDPNGAASQLWESAGTLGPGELFLGCTLLRGVSDADARKRLARCVPELLRAAWNAGSYHLRLEALHMVQTFGSVSEGDVRQAIVDILTALPSNNLFLNTAIVEALAAFDAIEPPDSPEAVLDEIRSILATPQDADARQRAYGLVSRQFEEVLAAAVMEALDRLDSRDRVELSAMASLGAPPYAHDGGWYVGELIGAHEFRDNVLVIEALAQWASAPRGDEVDLQGRVRGFVAAQVALARLCLQEPALSAGNESDEALWHHWGTVIRRAASPDSVSDEALRFAWDELQRCAPRTVSQLVWIDHEVEMWTIGGSRTLLRDAFPFDVKRLLESGLAKRPFQSRRHVALVGHDEGAAIRLLGALGDETSRRLLIKLVDVPELGAAAVTAIRSIDARS